MNRRPHRELGLHSGFYRNVCPLALDVLFAFGLLSVTASQLRLVGTAIGPGEACLAAWTVLMLIGEASRLGPPLTPVLGRLVIFWSLFACAESFGTLAGYAIGDVHDPGLFLHDILAYPLVAAISCLMVIEPGAAFRLRRVAWLLAAFGAAFLTLQLANASELFAVANIQPWYWDRLRGWAENPNQLAFLCVVLALVSLHLFETVRGVAAKSGAAACAVLAIYVGRLTKSDTFVLALVLAGPVFVALKLRSWLHTFDGAVAARYALGWIVILILPVVVLSVARFGDSIGTDVEAYAAEFSKDGGAGTQDEARLRIWAWREAINRSLETGMLGLGPGPHISIPDSIVAARHYKNEPENLDHPAVNGIPNFEAHNTIMDLLVQGGLVAVLGFIWLAATTFAATYRANLVALTALLVGLGVFSNFHLIVRYPLFWFAIALCLVTGTSGERTFAVRAGG
jgi:hypothetical protein